MRKRSVSYPSKTIFEIKDFVVQVFESGADPSALQLSDLAKFGSIPIREANAYASTSGHYGWMESKYGKGYELNSAVCKILRKPQDGELDDLYKRAFNAPELYKKMISKWNENRFPTIEAIEVYLIRECDFTDSGARNCAEVFTANAKGLGLIDAENIFKVDAAIVISEPEGKIKKTKPVKDELTARAGTKKTKDSQHTPAKEKPVMITPEQHQHKAKTISIFVRGRELHLQVLEDMGQGDWDAIIKQLQNIKTFSK